MNCLSLITWEGANSLYKVKRRSAEIFPIFQHKNMRIAWKKLSEICIKIDKASYIFTYAMEYHLIHIQDLILNLVTIKVASTDKIFGFLISQMDLTAAFHLIYSFMNFMSR